MTGWSILVFGAVSASGVLMFMLLVADTIAGAREGLRVFEKKAGQAYRQRMEAGPYVAGSTTIVAGGPPKGAVVVEEAA